MQEFIRHTGIGVPLRRADVDTDQIIPAVYLKSVARSGFEDGLFASWRTDPQFVLNQAAYAKGSILVAGLDFGTGSSREHAVWALMDYGFRVVVSPRFGPIFRSNSGKAGLLTAVVSHDVVEELWDALEANPGEELSVDLESRTIHAGPRSYGFEIDDYTRYRLLGGLDDISETLQSEEAIADYEAHRPGFKPTTVPQVATD